VKDKNSLVVLPTGLGKTIIAILVLVYKLANKRKILFLAPTKPLCDQHASFLRNITNLDIEDISVVTGETYTPKKRKEIYCKTKVVVATPQTIVNDLDETLFLTDYGLIIFDEVHRAVGDYSYVKIAENYSKVDNSQVLGITASPGSDYEKLHEVISNIDIKHIEIRNEWDEDVRPYLSSRFLKWELIELPSEVKQIAEKIYVILNELLIDLSKYTKQAKYLSSEKLSKKVLVEIQNRMRVNLGRRGGILYNGLILVSSLIKLSHLKDMLTSQGVTVAKTYISKLNSDNSRAAKKIKKHVLYDIIKKDIEEIIAVQPKLVKTKDIILNHLKVKKNARIIVFAEYRDTVDMLVHELNTINEIRAVKFIGQTRTDAEGGMSQIEQKQTLDDFRKDIFNVLVSTSIGEEGIDIPATSLVVFYEPVPSAIRHIQRKGRTARDGRPGEVMILIMKDSRDEAYYWNSKKKEEKMYSHVYRLKNNLEVKKVNKKIFERQTIIKEFIR
jgi:Fanconi anemia group M protein